MRELACIPLLPFAAFVILIFFGRRLKGVAPFVSIAALAGAIGITCSLLDAVAHGQTLSLRWAWLAREAPLWSVGLRVDGLSWLMLAVVTVIGTLIQLYSVGYMRDDPRASRFFAYLSLFCASMLLLVLADHFVLLYAGWELVGLCSYLLISFWFEKPQAAAAGRKAFLTTRLGDTGFLLGILLLAAVAGELHLDRIEAIRWKLLLQHQGGLLTAASLLVFFGAVGKSAQIPLHVWLPDAMEGPTPVSALIHAATMVAAGVYLVARTLPLFTAESLQIVLGIGLATHLLAGTVALTQTDIKRVLAYSTISQLGLMFVALGAEAVGAAMFHLFTHAFFKALLFLGAGSVIHATHEQELSRLGGLSRAMPFTAGLMLIASVSMSGLPIFSGFWSKDAILLAVGHRAPWLPPILLASAVITAAYVFRLYLLCFHGRGHFDFSHHASAGGKIEASPHESPWVMVLPMAVLGLGAIFGGFLGSPATHYAFFHFLGEHVSHEGVDLPLLAASALAAALGFFLAWQIGLQGRVPLPAGLRPLGHRLYELAYHKYYIDELYDLAIIRPFLAMTQALSRFDTSVIDGAVNGAGRLGWELGQLKQRFDQTVVDGFVNGVARAAQRLGALGRQLQTGVIHQYLLVVIGAAVTIALITTW